MAEGKVFNRWLHCGMYIAASSMKVGDESMSAIRFQTMAKGNLPHLSCILRKADPLGIDSKKVFYSVTGGLIFIEVQRGNEGKKHNN